MVDENKVTDDLIHTLFDVMNEIRKRTLYVCGLCGKVTTSIVQHHYSYFPEKIILVCNRCNNSHYISIHHPLLKPSPLEAKRFRSNKIPVRDGESFKESILILKDELDRIIQLKDYENHLSRLYKFVEELQDKVANEMIRESLHKMIDHPDENLSHNKIGKSIDKLIKKD